MKVGHRQPWSERTEAARRPNLASMGIYVFNRPNTSSTWLARNPTATDFGKGDHSPGLETWRQPQSYLLRRTTWEGHGTIGAFYEGHWRSPINQAGLFLSRRKNFRSTTRRVFASQASCWTPGHTKSIIGRGLLAPGPAAFIHCVARCALPGRGRWCVERTPW